MPGLQIVDLSPLPDNRNTPLDKMLAGFSQRKKDYQETDALKSIYDSYKREGQNIEDALIAVQTNPNLSPSTRVNTVNQLLMFQKQNNDMLLKNEKLFNERAKREQSTAVLRDLEKRGGLKEGELEPYANDLKTAKEIALKSNKTTQADRPIDPDQLERIKQVRDNPEFESASISKKQQMLQDAGVSASNQKSIIDPIAKESEVKQKETEATKKEQYKFHKDTEKYDDAIENEAKAAERQLQSAKDISRSVENVRPTDLANIFSFFGDTGRKLGQAFLSKDQALIQASIPAFLEGRKELFGVRLSDADLKLLSDKLPDMGKSLDANKAILGLIKKYSEQSLLKAKIAREIKKENKGFRPLDYRERIEDRMYEMTKEVKVIPPGSAKAKLIPYYQLNDAIKSGGTLVNE